MSIFSVIDNCDIRKAFNILVRHCDPNRSKNRMTSILDCSNTFIWRELDVRLFDITDTKNINGYVRQKKYDIIIYEPPYNNTFKKTTNYMSREFQNLLNNNGIIITRCKDFKLGNKEELLGTFELQDCFNKARFTLVDKVIYKNHQPVILEEHNKTQIVHSYFMIFKKR